MKRGFAREDLFVCVHEQFMTETARMADLVLPATMFLEHDDLYTGGGQQHIQLGLKRIDPPPLCRSNHEVIVALAERLGAAHPGFAMSPRELIDATLKASRRGSLAEMEGERGSSTCSLLTSAPTSSTASPIPTGASASGPTGRTSRWRRTARAGRRCRRCPTIGAPLMAATVEHPFRLATSPARNFLNSSFTETPTSLAKERHPTVMIHPEDAAPLGIGEGAWVRLSNERGAVTLRATLFSGLRRGVLIAESIWPNDAYPDGRGINTPDGRRRAGPVRGRGLPDNRVAIAALPQ